MSSPWWVGDGNRRGACGGDVRLHGRRRGRCQGGDDRWEAMMALSPIPFCPCDGHQTGLWYLTARWRDTTESAQGLLPAWAGSPLAGRVSRPLDGKRNYPAPVFVHSQTDKANQLW